jgi:hypothetical protein
MMPARHLILLAAATGLILSAADARRHPAADPAPAGPDLTIIPSGGEQALQYGDRVLPRPFGGELIDTLSVAGRFRIGKGSYYLVRGSGGSDCPSRYVVVAPSHGGSPSVTAPFGTCALASAGVSGGVLTVAMASSLAGGPPVRFAYIGGQMRPLDPMPAPAAETVAWGCGPMGDAQPVATLSADFDRSFPEDYRHVSRIAKMSIPPQELKRLVTGLACFATRPGAEKMVPEAAAALFASKQYGAASFAALDSVSHTPGVEADVVAAVRSFGAEMRYYVTRRMAI